MSAQARLASLALAATLIALLNTAAFANDADERIAGGDFEKIPENWINQAAGAAGVTSEWAEHGGRGGGGGIHVRNGPDSHLQICIWRFSIRPAPTGRKLHMRAWTRGSEVQTLAGFCAQAWNEKRDEMVGFATTQTASPLSGTFDWTQIETTLIVPEKASSVDILLMLCGTGEAWFDDVSAQEAGPATEAELREAGRSAAQPRSALPGVFLVRGEYEIRRGGGWRSFFQPDKSATDEPPADSTESSGSADRKGGAPSESSANESNPAGQDTGNDRRQTPSQAAAGPSFVWPVPLVHVGQVPLTYEIFTDPPGQIQSAGLREDQPGNWVAEVTLKPVARGKVVALKWRSLVLAAPRSFDDLPEHAPLPKDWPAEARPWLASTRCVQAGDEAIRHVAQDVRGARTDVLEIIDATLARCREIQRDQKGFCTELDAVQALEKRGSCTSCANLCAALLRGAGIPARILSGYPSWSGPLQTHYTVEAWVPGFGWYPIESTMLRRGLKPFEQIQVAIIPTAYEERSKARISAAGGVPYLSLTEYTPRTLHGHSASGAVIAAQNCDHVAEQQAAFPEETPAQEWEALIQRASQRWQLWLASNPAVGDDGALATPLRASQVDSSTAADLARSLER